MYGCLHINIYLLYLVFNYVTNLIGNQSVSGEVLFCNENCEDNITKLYWRWIYE